MKQQNPFEYGILLAVFGTMDSNTETLYRRIQSAIEKRFPGIPIYIAYTSSMMRKKALENGKNIDSVISALDRMAQSGITHAAVQSLHIIPGIEFHDIVKTAAAFRQIPDGFRRIAVGYPLLSAESDYERTADLLMDHIPPERTSQDAVVFMGHGTRHPSHAAYRNLAARLQMNRRFIFTGFLKGRPGVDDILTDLSQNQVKKAYLIPLMAVAGKHSRKDMAGDEPNSWKRLIEGRGVECAPVLKGLAENGRFIDIWIDHLQNAFERFDS